MTEDLDMGELMLCVLPLSTILMKPWSLEHFGYGAGLLKLYTSLWVTFCSTYNI